MKLMITLADGFEETEAVAVTDVLRRAGITIDIVGIPSSSVTSKNGIRIMTDKKLNEINVNNYDGIILPGGTKGVENLSKTALLLEMIKRLDAQGKLIAAICAAPSILAKIGVLEGKKATIYPGMERELPYPREDRVVIDSNVITSQAAGTAMEFALAIVEKLKGPGKASELKEHLLVR